MDHAGRGRRRATERLRIGPMVTPLPRRRPAKVARETVTLDRLGGGRLVLGVGLGEDRFGQRVLRTGEQTRRPAARPDAGRGAGRAGRAAWSGEPVRHRGAHSHGRRDAVPAAAGAAGRDTGVGGGLPREAGRPAAPGRPASTATSPSTSTHPEQLAEAVEPRSPSCAGGRADPERRSTWPVELPAGTDPAPWRRGRRHLVAGGVPAGRDVRGRGARRAAGRAGRDRRRADRRGQRGAAVRRHRTAIRPTRRSCSIHGACASLLWWDDELCDRLAAGGRFVIRYDQPRHRPLDQLPAGPARATALADLADDAIGVLDALGVRAGPPGGPVDGWRRPRWSPGWTGRSGSRR